MPRSVQSARASSRPAPFATLGSRTTLGPEFGGGALGARGVGGLVRGEAGPLQGLGEGGARPGLGVDDEGSYH